LPCRKSCKETLQILFLLISESFRNGHELLTFSVWRLAHFWSTNGTGFGNCGLSAKEHSGWDEEHVYDRMLKALSEEDENWKPGAHDFTDGRLRGHRHNHSQRNYQ